MIRVLQFTNIGYANGIASMLLSYYRAMNRNQIKFVFLAMDNIDIKDTYKTEIEQLGGDVIVVPHYSKGIFKFIKNVNNVIKTQKVNVLHLHQGIVSIPFIFTGKKLGLKIIIHSHSPKLNGKIKNILVKLSRPIFNKKTDYQIACSKLSADFLFGKNNKALIIPNPIDLNRFAYNENIRKIKREELKIEKSDFVFICVARFSEEKNQKFILDIFNQIVQKNKNFKLILIGNSEGLNFINSIIDEYNIKDNVLVFINRNDVPDFLSASDCYLAPSLFEGLGISLIEAQANGIPCIFSPAIIDDVKLNNNIIVFNLDHETWKNIMLNTDKLKRTNDIENLLNSCFNINKNKDVLSSIYLNSEN